MPPHGELAKLSPFLPPRPVHRACLLWRGLGAASAPASGRIALNGRRLQKLLEELFEDSLEARDAA